MSDATLHLKTLNSSTVGQVANKTVLVRVDYNVPLKKIDGIWQVTDDQRVKASLETLTFLLENQAKLVLVTHLGRPDGKKQSDLSLAPVVSRLQELLKRPVALVEEIEAVPAALQDVPIVMLQNIRFWPGEEKNDPDLAKQLAGLAEVFVNEAFSAAHRAHASVAGITKHLPSLAGIGFSREVAALGELMTAPKRPFVMVIGGKKISDKVGAVVNLAQVADVVLLGGGTANNFLKAEGIEIYKSVVEETAGSHSKRAVNYVKVAEELMNSTRQDRILLDGYIPLPKIIYPIDVIAAAKLEAKSGQVVELLNGQDDQAKQANLMYLDIGPKTIKLYQEILLQAGTIFWNGPMGVFESPAFQTGTEEVARTIAKSGAKTVLGGGDTIAAIEQFGLSDRFDYVSAAGGAALEFLSGQSLPGVKPLLQDK